MAQSWLLLGQSRELQDAEHNSTANVFTVTVCMRPGVQVTGDGTIPVCGAVLLQTSEHECLPPLIRVQVFGPQEIDISYMHQKECCSLVGKGFTLHRSKISTV